MTTKNTEAISDFKKTSQLVFHPEIGELEVYQHKNGAKIFQKEITKDSSETFTSDYFHECQRLESPHIMKIKELTQEGTGKKDSRFLFYCEYFEGTLKGEIKKRSLSNNRFTQQEVLTLLAQMSSALVCIHMGDLAYGEVKSTNIVKVEGHYKLLNPVFFERRYSKLHAETPTFGRVDKKKGSKSEHRAHEEEEVHTKKQRDDVYDLGLVAAEMMTLSVDKSMSLDEKLDAARHLYNEVLADLLKEMLGSQSTFRANPEVCLVYIQDIMQDNAGGISFAQRFRKPSLEINLMKTIEEMKKKPEDEVNIGDTEQDEPEHALEGSLIEIQPFVEEESPKIKQNQEVREEDSPIKASFALEELIGTKEQEVEVIDSPLEEESLDEEDELTDKEEEKEEEKRVPDYKVYLVTASNDSLDDEEEDHFVANKLESENPEEDNQFDFKVSIIDSYNPDSASIKKDEKPEIVEEQVVEPEVIKAPEEEMLKQVEKPPQSLTDNSLLNDSTLHEEGHLRNTSAENPLVSRDSLLSPTSTAKSHNKVRTQTNISSIFQDILKGGNVIIRESADRKAKVRSVSAGGQNIAGISTGKDAERKEKKRPESNATLSTLAQINEDLGTHVEDAQVIIETIETLQDENIEEGVEGLEKGTHIFEENYKMIKDDLSKITAKKKNLRIFDDKPAVSYANAANLDNRRSFALNEALEKKSDVEKPEGVKKTEMVERGEQTEKIEEKPVLSPEKKSKMEINLTAPKFLSDFTKSLTNLWEGAETLKNDLFKHDLFKKKQKEELNTSVSINKENIGAQTDVTEKKEENILQETKKENKQAVFYKSVPKLDAAVLKSQELTYSKAYDLPKTPTQVPSHVHYTPSSSRTSYFDNYDDVRRGSADFSHLRNQTTSFVSTPTYNQSYTARPDTQMRGSMINPSFTSTPTHNQSFTARADSYMRGSMINTSSFVSTPTHQPYSARADPQMRASMVSSSSSSIYNFNYPTYNKEPEIKLPTGRKVTEKLDDGSVYHGEVLGYIRQGNGRMTYPDGTYYEGTWDLGQRSGYGVLYGPDKGVIYQGNWKYNKFNGFGALFNTDQQYKKIDWEERAKLIKKDTSNWYKYEGTFKDGQWDGYGKLQLKFGEMFVGVFKSDSYDLEENKLNVQVKRW